MAVFILIPAAWGIVLGLVSSRLIFLPPLVVGACLATSLALMFPAWLWQHQLWLQMGCFICGLAIGVMLWQNTQVINQYQTITGANLDMHGEVVARPRITSSGNQAVVVRPDGFTQNLRVSLFHHAYVHTGDRIWLRGQIKQPENFNQFDYVNYLKQQHVYAELSKARLVVITAAQPSISTYLNQLRQHFINRAEFIFTEPTAAIILGMLIGEQEQLPNNIQQAFQKAGLVHILVVSGFNLTIIAMGIGILAHVFGRRPADLLSLGIIWLFVILVGGSAAVTRAGVMASLLILARLWGRLALSQVSLLLAVVVMTVLNPWRLFYDIGFQLSIAATFGVLEANRLRLSFEQDSWLAELSWASCGAIIMTAPLVAYYFGTFSVIAPLANLLILPTVPYLMLVGALALLPYLQTIFLPLTETMINLEINLITWLANLPFSQIEIKPDFVIIVSYYLMVIVSLHFIKFYKKPRLKESSSHAKITKITI